MYELGARGTVMQSESGRHSQRRALLRKRTSLMYLTDRRQKSWDRSCHAFFTSNPYQLLSHPILPFIKTGSVTMMAGFEPVAMTALIFGGCCTNVFALENILK